MTRDRAKDQKEKERWEDRRTGADKKTGRRTRMGRHTVSPLRAIFGRVGDSCLVNGT